MLKTDQEALECDLAETYRIYDMKSFPAYKIAVFACGLRENSRIMMKMSNKTVSDELMIQASILDTQNMLLWTKAKKGTPKPDSIVSKLLGRDDQKKDKIVSFASPEDFEAARQAILGGGA